MAKSYKQICENLTPSKAEIEALKTVVIGCNMNMRLHAKTEYINAINVAAAYIRRLEDEVRGT